MCNRALTNLERATGQVERETGIQEVPTGGMVLSIKPEGKYWMIDLSGKIFISKTVNGAINQLIKHLKSVFNHQPEPEEKGEDAEVGAL